MQFMTLTAAMWLILILTPRGGQETETALMGGRVTDENGTAIASATVSARNAFCEETRTVRTKMDGTYTITGMRQGRYTVFAHAEGYGCTWVMNVFLYRGRHTKLDVVLTTSRKGVPSSRCTEETK